VVAEVVVAAGQTPTRLTPIAVSKFSRDSSESLHSPGKAMLRIHLSDQWILSPFRGVVFDDVIEVLRLCLTSCYALGYGLN
jgi:hypothetical protein